MPAGRPTDYSEEILSKAKEYLELCQDTYDKDTKKTKVNLPNLGGMARHIGVARSTIYEWAKKYKEFSDILEDILSEQESRLINNSISGDYNPTITKVLLTKHGYREGVETTGKDGGAIAIDVNEKNAIDNAIKRAILSDDQGNNP